MQESDNDYMNNKNPQNPKLGIGDVSGQSELLLDFCYWLNANRIGDIKDYLDIEEVEEYLKSSNSH